MIQPKIWTFPLENDYSGTVVSTLVEYSKEKSNTAILYIHGFIDYFFQEHVALHFNQQGHSFYALDLRKCGRSILDHHRPHYVRNIEEYDEEIDLAVQKIKENGAETLVLLGHSMGGLVCTNYVHKGRLKDRVDGMILNAPFFDYNKPKWMRDLVPMIAGWLSKVFPYVGIPEAVNPLYPKSIHKNYYGEWNFDLKKKPIEGFPAYFAFLSAIRKSQKWVMKYSAWNKPVLVLASTKSYIPKKAWDDRLGGCDAVLNVDEIVSIAESIGNHTETCRFEGALHDVFLSKLEVRQAALHKSTDWLQRKFKPIVS